MRISLLASGSKGNAALIDNGDTRILIDAGLSAREICRRMELRGIDPATIDALLVTHEHTDHIRGLGPLVRRLNIPVYLHTDIAGKLADVGKPEAVKEFVDGPEWQLGSLSLQAFSVTHDAGAPVGFVIEGAKGKVGFATDLGIATRLVVQSLQNCQALVVETNHDEEMLRDGPYPWSLKQRVRSNHGHLSNSAGGQLLDQLLWPGLETVLLAHLSDTNNEPELAYRAVDDVLAHQNQCSPDVKVCRQDEPSGWVELK